MTDGQVTRTKDEDIGRVLCDADRAEDTGDCGK